MPKETPAEKIFFEVLEKPLSERAKFLDQHCDEALRQEVESLLAAHEGMGEFLENTISRLHLDQQHQETPHKSVQQNSDSSLHGRFVPGHVIDGRYRIVSLIGRGGMGEVYRADDLKLGQTVALKFLPEGFSEDPKRLEYFHQEVRLTRQISHPNVCRVYDIGEVDGQHFLSMEYIDGEDLKVLLRRIGRLPEDKGAEIAQQLCAAVSAAHDKGVLHRDLKPANIMIDGRGQVRITDFGLARLADHAAKREIAGTPAYMAPEQFERGETSIRSDLYSLGLILAEVFVGKRVADPQNLSESLQSASTEGSSSHGSSIRLDPLIQRAIVRCLQEQPSDRPASARELASVLPGGDPLERALATGATPSPELVANATDQGNLRFPVAVGLLIFIGATIVITVLFGRHVRMIQQPPAVLSARCVEIMRELGHQELPENSFEGIDVNRDLRDALNESPHDRRWLESQAQPPWQFWKRWTSGSFVILKLHAPEVVAVDSPTTKRSGNATVIIDEEGHLLGLKIEPEIPTFDDDDEEEEEEEEEEDYVDDNGDDEPRDDDSRSIATASQEFDFQSLLPLAGIEPNDAQTIEVVTEPSVHCSRVAAWRVSPGTERERIIQAGIRDGKPVYFEQLGLNEAMNTPDRQIANPMPYILSGIVTFMWCFVGLTAWRNWRSSRGDRRGAFRLAIAVIVAYLILEVSCFRPSTPDFIRHQYMELFNRSLGHALIHGIEVWLIYFALEPYVRRLAPRSLIGVARILDGRWRDRRVGQEVLVGTAAGCLTHLLYRSESFITLLRSAGDVVFLPDQGRQLAGGSEWLTIFIHTVAGAMLTPFFIGAVLVAICLFLRRRKIDLLVTGVFLGFASLLLFGVMFATGNSDVATRLTMILSALVFVSVATRVGFLALYVTVAMGFLPGIELADPGAWYATYGGLTIMVTLLIALFGFSQSQGGWSRVFGFLEEGRAGPEQPLA